MSDRIFVTGMIRSGTSLVQVLLHNHPDAFVVYQPFHQLHVDVKQRFLEEQGTARDLPLGDGMTEPPGEQDQFRRWLSERSFTEAEAAELVGAAPLGKGGSVPELAGRLAPVAGTFHELHAALLQQVATHFGASDGRLLGSKEVLCEEYVPAVLDAGARSVVVLRDPRAVIASANNGSYRDLVGDRYPVLMLVRLWRKSARYALEAAGRPGGCWVRYEDVATDPAAAMDAVAARLGLSSYEAGALDGPLHDHTGQPWQGNSSFGSKPGVDATSTTAWRDLLDPATARFVEACTHPELRELGFETDIEADEAREVIERYVEDEAGVRTSYLERYRLDDAARQQELTRTTPDRSR
jgi:hypothetical protein